MEVVIVIGVILVLFVAVVFSINRSCKKEIAKVARTEYLHGFGEAIQQLNSFDGKGFADKKYAEFKEKR